MCSVTIAENYKTLALENYICVVALASGLQQVSFHLHPRGFITSNVRPGVAEIHRAGNYEG